MTEPVDRFSSEYLEALEAYLRTGDEAALSDAYEIGRRAMIEGLGILDMATLHQRAVEGVVLPAAAVDRSRLASAVGQFFNEALSAFEMAFRGYRSANEELRRLNETLARKKEALELVNRELESFSYSVSHDLRAPLRSIDGFSAALLEDSADTLDEHGKDYLRRVRDATERMGELIDDLLELARVTRSELVKVDLDLSALAQRVADRMHASAPARTVHFHCQDGVRGRGDAHLVTILLENLLGNAWKFTSKLTDAEVEFGRINHSSRPAYFVRDNGAGFDMAYAGKLFGAFQRLHSGAEFEGTGIGLATVQRIVQRHNGRVWAEGQVGAGATFYFTLGEEEAGS